MEYKEYIEPLTDLNTPTNEELKQMYNELADKVNFLLELTYCGHMCSNEIKRWGE